MNAHAKASVVPTGPLVKPDPNSPAFVVLDRTSIAVKAGVMFGAIAFAATTVIPFAVPFVAGSDYAIVVLADDSLSLLSAADGVPENSLGYTVIGGFHVAPGGNAEARAGGDTVPAINPHSVWDLGYRPACPDPRGMACVELSGGKRFWCDIYLLGADAFRHNCTSLHDAVTADGDDTPGRADDGVYEVLDWETSKAILAEFGKQLLGPEEFFAAAFGVTEGTSLGSDPKRTGLDAARTSKWGIMQATGNMSTWGLDGDPDGPRQAWRFGGDWVVGEFAGSRCAYVGRWPVNSSGWIGARGRSDHLQLV